MGGPGDRDRTMAVKRRKNAQKSVFFVKRKSAFFIKNIGGKQIFSLGSFPEVGQKQKTEKKEEKKRPKVGDNNGQATHGARKHAWRTQAAWANFAFCKYLSLIGMSVRFYPSVLKAINFDKAII